MSCFRMPVAGSIVGRTSSITNCFVSAIIPVVQPTETEVAEALEILGLSAGDLRCAYCGDRNTEWDHLRPLIIDKRPTGYISEIRNLVPACGKCNQSKGNKHWRAWMVSAAPLSPRARGVEGLDQRIARLEAFEAWGEPIRVDFEKCLGKSDWETHWENWSAVLAELKRAQDFADLLRERLTASAVE